MKFFRLTKILLITLVISSMTASCNKFNTAAGTEAEFKVAVSEDSSPVSKVSYGTAGPTATTQPIKWEEDDEITIYCNECSGAKVKDYVVSEVNPDGTDSESYATISNKGDGGLIWGTGLHTFYAIYPSVNTTGVTATITGKDITGSIPESQGHGTVTGTTAKVVPPDMKNLFMSAKNSIQAGEAGTPVFLDFKPLSTVIEFTISNGFQETESDMIINSISLISAGHALCGGFCADLDQTGLYNRPKTSLPSTTVIANCDSVAINFGSSPVTVAYENTLNFMFFLNPGNATEVNDLTLEIKGSYANSGPQFTRRANLLYSDGTGITFQTHKKTRVKGVSTPESLAIEFGDDIVVIPWTVNTSGEVVIQN